MQKSALTLKESISHLAFPVTPNSPCLRRSRRNVGTTNVDVKAEPSPSPSLPARTSTKRKLLKDEHEEDGSPKAKRSASKRGYAAPETYAHLKGLHDHLALHLDVIFCGINPGYKSATDGHHFAHPSNHFWRCLHRSGFTPTCLPPSKDFTLPSLFNLGLTNLVERPSSEAAELSKGEMKQSVPALKSKIIAYRPRIVCFVGKQIWMVTESAFKSQIASIRDPVTSDSEKKLTKISPPLTPKKPSPKGKATKKAKSAFNWGLQPYKLVYPDGEFNNTIESKETFASSSGENSSGAHPQAVNSGNAVPTRETLFFVMPSTSGLVVSHQLNDKAKLFAQLRGDLERAKSNAFDTNDMVAIPLI